MAYVCVCREVAFRVCVSVRANVPVNANVNNCEERKRRELRGENGVRK